MINKRLFKQYGIDIEKNLKLEVRCPRPYDTVLIDKNGSVYACECTSWLPQSIGNLQVKSLEDMFAGSMAGELRDSMADGTYRYCNNKQCSYLKDTEILKRRSAWNRAPQVLIRHIRLAMDESCNLKCPSCRTDQILHTSGSQFEMRKRLVKKVLEYIKHRIKMPNSLRVHIGSDGDPFASLIYRYFMKEMAAYDSDYLEYTMQTNGLLVKQLSNRVPHIFKRMSILAVSIDGATKETYEKLRLGGSWKKINENLRHIQELAHHYDFVFQMHMVVQADNWREMPAMAALARSVDAEVQFNPIEDWQTFDNFEEKRCPEELDEFKSVCDEVARQDHVYAWFKTNTVLREFIQPD